LGNGGFNHVASPHPAAASKSGNRIIASDLPSAGKSASSLDLPARRNVLQIDIPTSQTQTTSFNYNAGTQQAPNMKLQFHGIEPVKPTFHGRFKEVKANVKIPKDKKKAKKDKKAKKIEKENRKNIDLNKVKEDALNTAKKIENTATTLLSEVHASPTQMSVPIHFKNKRQTNNLKLDKKHV